MAFANLFKGLSAVTEEDKSRCEAAALLRDESNSGRRAKAKKRKRQLKETGPDNHKQPCQAHKRSTWRSFKDDGSPAIRSHMQSVVHSGKAGHMYHKGQSYQTKNSFYINKQQQQLKEKGNGQNYPHQQRDRGGHSNRGGRPYNRSNWRRGGGTCRFGRQDFDLKHTRSMSQEFKDQNALLVDGQLLCRHFLWGRCVKADECQLKHIQGSNDLIKQGCKFYIQGLCTKGESCPYMHKSFPCKFFHRKEKCSHGTDCRFSHVPLNETTTRLLDEALKRDIDFYEHTKKAELESLGQPENTDKLEMEEANITPDVLVQPLRPNFYNSGETNTAQEASSCETEIPEISLPPQASDGVNTHNLLSTNPNHQTPVCYSVEALLGPKLFKPFQSFYGSQESTSQSGPQDYSVCSSGSADQSQVTYSGHSVDTVQPVKSSGCATFGHIFAPPVSQNTDCEELIDPLPSSDTEKVPYFPSTRNEGNSYHERRFKSLSPPHVHSDLISKRCPDPTLASGNQDREIAASLQPAQRASHEVKFELGSLNTVAEKSKIKGDPQGSTHIPVDILHSVNYKSKHVLPFATTMHRSRSFTPTRPEKLNAQTSGQRSKTQAPVNPLSPTLGISKFGFGPAELATAKTGDSGNSVTHHFANKQSSGTHQHSKTPQYGPKPGRQKYSTETTAECSSKMALCGDLSVSCGKTQKKTFSSLFAGPISESLKSTPGLLTSPASPQDSNESSHFTPQSTQARSADADVKTVDEPDKVSARTFLGLFATPLSATVLPCLQPQLDSTQTASDFQESNQSTDNPCHLTDSKRRPSTSETPLPHQVKTDVKQSAHRSTAPTFSPSPKNERQGDLSGPASQPTKEQMNPVSSHVPASLSEISSTSTTQAQPLPNLSSSKGCAVAEPTACSVLKTLFLCLSPFDQDGQHQLSVASESAKEHSNSVGQSVSDEQRKSRKKTRKKKTPNPHQQATGLEPSFQMSPICMEATVGLAATTAPMTELQETHATAHNFPFKPVTQTCEPMQNSPQSRLKNTSEDGKWASGNMTVKPLKELFKTFDTSVFNFRQ